MGATIRAVGCPGLNPGFICCALSFAAAGKRSAL